MTDQLDVHVQDDELRPNTPSGSSGSPSSCSVAACIPSRPWASRTVLCEPEPSLFAATRIAGQGWRRGRRRARPLWTQHAYADGGMPKSATGILLREKGETQRWQPVSPTLMTHLQAHARERHAPPNGRSRHRDWTICTGLPSGSAVHAISSRPSHTCGEARAGAPPATRSS